MNNNYPLRQPNMVIPYTIVESVQELIDFVKKIFNGKLLYQINRPTGEIIQAELKIGNTVIKANESRDYLDSSPISLYIYVDDCDTVYHMALEYGCESIIPLTNMKHIGERYGGIRDKNGNTWWIATQVENLTYEEQVRRIQEKRETKSDILSNNFETFYINKYI